MQKKSDLSLLKKRNTWVFDLDNTLYPNTSNLFAQVDKKMTEFIMEHLNLDFEPARKLQKEYYANHGTTLSGLMKHHNVKPNHFMDSVHAIDYSPIKRCDVLINALNNMNVKKYVLTNGTKNHAVCVLKRLGLEGAFDGLFGIEDCNFIPKPEAKTYEIFMDKFNVVADKSVFVEDMAKNLSVPKDMGFKTVYVKTDCPYASSDLFEDKIDYKCDNIGDFLASIGH